MRTVLALASMTAVSVFANSSVTFDKDVLPILQKHCQSCHRPGEVAPMSLLTYQDARPWAKSIKSAVLTKQMPPWFSATSSHGFTNARVLKQEEIDTLVAWVDGGSVEGNKKDTPAPLKFTDGWNLRPDIVIDAPEFSVPASGTLDYRFVVVKVNFPKDLWIQAAEIRPGDRQHVHHMKALVRPPGSSYMAQATPGAYMTMSEIRKASKGGPRSDVDMEGGLMDEILAKYNPGLDVQRFDVDGAAKFIPKGSDIVFECHFTSNGKESTFRPKVGIMLADGPPQQRYFTTGELTNHKFTLPAGDSNAEVSEEVEVENAADLVWIQPHMHLRGKDYELRAIYPTGETETLLKTNFDFNWQLGYEFAKPIVLPKGTRLIGISHFDNSANNKYNPDPTVDVHYGPQNWDEMSVGFFSVVVPANTDLAHLFKKIIPAETSKLSAAGSPGGSK